MTKEILKRIFYPFLISTIVTLTYAFMTYPSTIGLEARQACFIIILMNLGFCFLNFILSLTSLLNLNHFIRQNSWLSMLSFFTFPIVLLVILLIQFIDNHNENETIKDFLVIAHTSVTFCLILIYQFYRFRQTTKSADT